MPTRKKIITASTATRLTNTRVPFVDANGDLVDASNLVFAAATTGLQVVSARLQGAKGADVASGANITLGNDGNMFDITGITTITTIASTNWQAGSIIVLQFDGSLTVSHNVAGTGASILLAGAANFSATANDVLQLIYDGTTWREVSRTVI